MKIFQKLRSLFKKPKQKSAPQDEFTVLWQGVFTQKADIFCGLFGGMYKLSKGEMKRKKNVLTEWCTRVTNRLDESAVTSMENTIRPLILQELPDETKSMAEKLMQAAEAAGIRHDADPEITITENNQDDYINLESDDLAPGDRVKILSPAWYNGDKLLEKGTAKLI